jgi:hypothetical protein
MSRYSDEQLSMLLGEHDAGQLERIGSLRWHGWDSDIYPRACAVQVMFNLDSNEDAAGVDFTTATRFDNHYFTSMSPEELLSLVAGVGR